MIFARESNMVGKGERGDKASETQALSLTYQTKNLEVQLLSVTLRLLFFMPVR